MKKSTKYLQGFECNFSFEDLYKAAFGKVLSQEEKEKLQKLPQQKINSLILEWANKANWNIYPKLGTDGKKYLAFYPTVTD